MKQVIIGTYNNPGSSDINSKYNCRRVMQIPPSAAKTIDMLQNRMKNVMIKDQNKQN